MRLPTVTLLGLILLIFGQFVAAQERVTANRVVGLAPSHQKTHFSEVVYPNALVPFWDSGYLITRELESTSPTTPNVVLWDAEGKRAREGRIWFDGASQIAIRHVAVTSDGRILASGRAITTNGATAFFIARTDLTGRVTDVIRTSPYSPEMICASPDGTVWAFGVDTEMHSARKNYKMLRQFSFEAGHLLEFVTRWSFATPIPPSLVYGGPQGSILRCGKESVGLYINPTNEYIEMNLTTRRGQRWQIDATALGKAKVSGLGLADDGRVFASLTEAYSGSIPGLVGLFQLEKDPQSQSARWVPVPGAAGRFENWSDVPRGSVLRMWGLKGEDLILVRSGEGHLSRSRLLLESNER